MYFSFFRFFISTSVANNRAYILQPESYKLCNILYSTCNWFIWVSMSTISAVSAWLYLSFVLIVFSVFLSHVIMANKWSVDWLIEFNRAVTVVACFSDASRVIISVLSMYVSTAVLWLQCCVLITAQYQETKVSGQWVGGHSGACVCIHNQWPRYVEPAGRSFAANYSVSGRTFFRSFIQPHTISTTTDNASSDSMSSRRNTGLRLCVLYSRSQWTQSHRCMT